MSWLGKYKWAFIVVSVLILLALHRNHMSQKQMSDETSQRPPIHEVAEKGFAAIPERVSEAFQAGIAPERITGELEAGIESAKELVVDSVDEIERYSMAADGGDFNASQFKPKSNATLQTDDNDQFKTEQLATDAGSLLEDTATAAQEYLAQGSADSTIELNPEELVTTNPALQNIQQGIMEAGESQDAVADSFAASVESVPDFEPAFAMAPQRRAVNIPHGVVVKAVNHIEYGKSLARRGAAFGAKQEFISALKLVAQTMDQLRGGNAHADAFFEAIQALRESEDFYKAQAEMHRKVDVVAIAKSHKSKVADPQYMTGLNPMQAMQMYYDFIQDRLVACSGNLVVTGEALYSLGKLHQVNAKDPIRGSQLDNAKSIVFYKAAVNCDPRSYKSANELGVYLAKAGQYEEAKRLFVQSLQVHQISKVWENLARVHQHLGEGNLARLASDEYRRMLEGPAGDQIIWVKPEQFAKQGHQGLSLRTANAKASSVVPPTPVESKQPTRGLRNMMKKLF